MITLLCGIPGHGKTLYLVSELAKQWAKDGRQVYYAGIPECKVEGWKEIPGANALDARTLEYTPEALAAARRWFDLPSGSVVVIDEAHQVFPQRGPSASKPDYVGMAAVLRRLGLDLVLITQDGNSLDHFVRRRCGRYLHVWRTMGLQRATVWEFPKWCDWEDYHTRNLAVRHQFLYPKDAYALYKSATLHTVKRRIPAKVLWIPLGALGICVCFFFGYRALFGGSAASGKAAAQKASGAIAQVSEEKRSDSVSRLVTPQDYLLARVPRFADIPHSAPVYDELAKVVEFPQVVACIEARAKCRCYSQQGTVLASVSGEFCKAFVKDGAFNPYLIAHNARGYGGAPSPHAEPQIAAGTLYTPPARASQGPDATPTEQPVTFPERAGGQGRAAARPRS